MIDNKWKIPEITSAARSAATVISEGGLTCTVPAGRCAAFCFFISSASASKLAPAASIKKPWAFGPGQELYTCTSGDGHRTFFGLGRSLCGLKGIVIERIKSNLFNIKLQTYRTPKRCIGSILKPDPVFIFCSLFYREHP